MYSTGTIQNVTFNKGRCAQIPAIFENLIPRPEEKKDIHRHTHF